MTNTLGKGLQHWASASLFSESHLEPPVVCHCYRQSTSFNKMSTKRRKRMKKVASKGFSAKSQLSCLFHYIFWRDGRIPPPACHKVVAAIRDHSHIFGMALQVGWIANDCNEPVEHSWTVWGAHSVRQNLSLSPCEKEKVLQPGGCKTVHTSWTGGSA